MSLPRASAGVDIVVPVHNAASDLRRCVESVLDRTGGDYTLLLIDDGSSDPGVASYFADLEQRRDPRIVLERSTVNRGFTYTANRGMRHSCADVVLLNSDTVVTADWLDALLRCAASDSRIATVTPFSNNAEICSFPLFCTDNGCDESADAERIRAAIAGAAVPTYPDLPTGVGFCMFVRRAAIDAIGEFDLAFGAGYGEENDFCLRASAAGWRNVLADDAFVVHVGARSFEGRKSDLSARNLDLLVRRHPHYPALVRDYIAADPLKPIRDAAASRLDGDRSPCHVLHVIHDHGGGTETHVRTLIGAAGDGWCHYVATAVGDHWQVDEHVDGRRMRAFAFVRGDAESWRDFVGGIAATFAITLVHLHHVSRSREGALAALPALDIPYGITIHDLWLACPTVTLTRADDRFCGGVIDADACTRCLQAHPRFGDTDIVRWRGEHAELLAGAEFVIAPSKWAADMIGRYFPSTLGRIDVIPNAAPEHAFGAAESAEQSPLRAVLLPRDNVPVVAIVGAIGHDKGARRIERLAELIRDRRERLRLVVIGYLDVRHAPWQSSDAVLTLHGPYSRTDLPALFAHYRVQLVLFPSEGPESFSYTLSEAWHSGVPALVPPIGALPERMTETGAGWIMTGDEWNDDDRMLDRVLALLHSRDTRDAAAARALSVAHVTARAMAAATLRNYQTTVSDSRGSIAVRPISNRRVRDALGYRPWTPPAAFVPARVLAESPHRRGIWKQIALRALAIRRTPVGRMLYRIAPVQLIDALKARLDG